MILLILVHTKSALNINLEITRMVTWDKSSVFITRVQKIHYKGRITKVQALFHLTSGLTDVGLNQENSLSIYAY